MWSDVLRNRYPYRDISFEQRFQEDSFKAYPGFQHHGLQRNINSLASEHFSLQEKCKALKILYKTIISDELRNEAIQHGITKGLHYLLHHSPLEEEVLEYSCKIITQLCKVRQGIESCDQDQVDVLLLQLMNNDQTTTPLQIIHCSQALLSISNSCDVLIPKHKQTIPILSKLLSKEGIIETDFCIILMQILYNIVRRNVEGRQQCIEHQIILIITQIMNQITKTKDSNYMQLLQYCNIVLNNIVIEEGAKPLTTDFGFLFDCIHYFLHFKNEQQIDITINSISLIIILESAKILFCKTTTNIEELIDLNDKVHLDSVRKLLQQCNMYLASLWRE